MGDRAADLARRPFDIHVDPLMIAGGVGEQVDPILCDLQPVRDADLGPDQPWQLRKTHRFHRCILRWPRAAISIDRPQVGKPPCDEGLTRRPLAGPWVRVSASIERFREHEIMADDVSIFAAARAEAYSTPLDKIDPSVQDRFVTNTIWPFFERLRHEDPVHYTAESEFGPFWAVTKFNDIMTIETNHAAFSSEGAISIY